MLAGAAASAINAVAGGGTLISFPTLFSLGAPSVVANATNSVALWPGGLSSALAFWRQRGATRTHLRALLAPSLLGSLTGGWLLVHTSERAFGLAVPLLLLVATTLLALQPRIRRFLGEAHAHVPRPVGMLLQLLVSVYGGYFGAGMGILMLAVFGLFVDGTLHELNALKNWLGLVINLTAAAFFLARGLVWIVPALALMLGAIVGGYCSARWSQRVNPDKLRRVVVVLGAVMTLRFAWAARDLW